MSRLHGVLVLGLILLASCDQLPVIRLDNTTLDPVAIRFQPVKAGDRWLVDKHYELASRRSARFPASYLAEHQLVIAVGRCAYTYPLGREAIEYDYGAHTDLALGRDLRVYVWSRWSPVQPKGWPLAPISKDCR